MYLHNVLKYNLFLIKTHFIYIETFINCVVVIHYKSQNNTAQIHFNSIMMKYRHNCTNFYEQIIDIHTLKRFIS